MRLLLSQQGSLARLGHLRRRGPLFGLTATSDRLTTWLVKGYFYGDAAPTLISIIFLDSCSFPLYVVEDDQYCWLGCW